MTERLLGWQQPCMYIEYINFNQCRDATYYYFSSKKHLPPSYINILINNKTVIGFGFHMI